MRTRSIVAIGFCAALVLGLFGLVSCGSSGSKGTADQETTQVPAEASAQESAKVPETQTTPAGNGGWMEGIPATVPPFPYGTFDSKESYKAPVGDNVMYSLYYEGVTLEQAKEYGAKLTAAGFQVQEENSRPGDWNILGSMPQGEGRISCTLGFQASGHVDLSIGVAKKYE